MVPDSSTGTEEGKNKQNKCLTLLSPKCALFHLNIVFSADVTMVTSGVPLDTCPLSSILVHSLEQSPCFRSVSFSHVLFLTSSWLYLHVCSVLLHFLILKPWALHNKNKHLCSYICVQYFFVSCWTHYINFCCLWRAACHMFPSFLFLSFRVIDTNSYNNISWRSSHFNFMACHFQENNIYVFDDSSCTGFVFVQLNALNKVYVPPPGAWLALQ